MEVREFLRTHYFCLSRRRVGISLGKCPQFLSFEKWCVWFYQFLILTYFALRQNFILYGNVSIQITHGNVACAIYIFTPHSLWCDMCPNIDWRAHYTTHKVVQWKRLRFKKQNVGQQTFRRWSLQCHLLNVKQCSKIWRPWNSPVRLHYTGESRL